MNKIFYATSAANMPNGAGYYKIHANSEEAARKLVHDHTNGRWCFMYYSLEDIHPLDRRLIEVL